MCVWRPCTLCMGSRCVCVCVCVMLVNVFSNVLPSGQHSLLRRRGPPGVRPPPLRRHHPRPDWTDALSQEAARPIEGLPIAHRGHRGVSDDGGSMVRNAYLMKG